MANNSNQPLTANNLEAHDQNHDDEDGTDGQRRAQRGTARRGSIDLDPDTTNVNGESYLEYVNSPDRYWNMHKRTGSGSSCASSLNSIECDEFEALEVNTTVTTDNRSRKSDDDSDHSVVDESFDNDKSTKHELGRRESVEILPANADHDEPEEDDDNSIQHLTEATKTSSPTSSPGEGEGEGELGDDITEQSAATNIVQNNWPKPLVMVVMMMIIIYGLFVKCQQMISHVQDIGSIKANTDNITVSKMSEMDEILCDAVFNGSVNVYNYLMGDDNVWQYK